MKITSSPAALYAKQHAELVADIAAFLSEQAKIIIPEVVKQYGGAQKSLLHRALIKSDDPQPEDIQLDGWDDMVEKSIKPVAVGIFAAAGAWALKQLTQQILVDALTPGEEPKTPAEKTAIIESITKQVNQDAVAYAKERSGALVTQITDSTRQMVADTVASALQDNLGSYGLADRLATSKIFSPQRADLIASYELGTASEAGNMAAWKRSGVVTGKQWLTASDEIVSDVCTINEEAGIVAIDDAFPSGDQHPLAHPHCRCTMTAVTKSAKVGKAEFYSAFKTRLTS